MKSDLEEITSVPLPIRKPTAPVGAPSCYPVAASPTVSLTSHQPIAMRAGSVDRYSVRSAAVASDDLRNSSSSDAWFDRNRQQLHCNGNSFERGSQVLVYQQGQRVEDMWTMTAMNAVEVTLRDSDSQKLKVTLAQLRNGRFVFRPGGDR